MSLTGTVYNPEGKEGKVAVKIDFGDIRGYARHLLERLPQE